MHAEVMQPDDATLRRILEDSDLMNGFDDPAVMSAVADIAHNPAALSKHTAKVSNTLGLAVPIPLQLSASDFVLH